MFSAAATLAIVANAVTIATPLLDVALDRLVPEFGGGQNTSISRADLQKLLSTLDKAQQILDEVDYEQLLNYPVDIRDLKDGIYQAQDIFEEMSICNLLQQNPVFPHLLLPNSITDLQKILDFTINNLMAEGFRVHSHHSQLGSEDLVTDLVNQINSLLPSSSNSNHRIGLLNNLWPSFLHLQKCFLLASIYPKSHKFEKGDLIQLWRAQGFIRKDRVGTQTLEDIGSDYLRELVEKNIFSNSDDFYQINDELHELAKVVSLDECLTINNGVAVRDLSSPTMIYLRHFSLLRKSTGRDARHVTVNEDLATCEKHIQAKCEGLRTFLLHIEGGRETHEFCFKRLAFFKFLRVLDISCSSITTVTDSISCLKNLRYFNLCTSRIKKLPRTIRKLQRLWILKLNGCDELKDLPDLGELVNLRHLLLGKNHRLESLPPGIGQLINLETFSCPFVVGIGNGENIGELKNMNNLRGSLCISKLENVRSLNEASEAALHEKQYLQKLKFKWTENEKCDSYEVVLAQLKPHTTLEVLKLYGYGGQVFPDWMSNPDFLPNLTKVSLSKCNGCVDLPAFWRLQSLKSLSLSMSRTEQPMTLNIDFGDTGFVSLETLKLKNMPHMTRWVVDQAGAVGCCPFPELRQLIFKNCPTLVDLDVLHWQHGDDVLLPFPKLNLLTFQECPQLRDLEFLQRLNSNCRLKIKNCPLNGLYPDWQREGQEGESIIYSRGNWLTNRLRGLRRRSNWF